MKLYNHFFRIIIFSLALSSLPPHVIHVIFTITSLACAKKKCFNLDKNYIFIITTKISIIFSISVHALRVKRQEATTAKNEESFEKELCKDKDAGEWFRLVAGDGDACRDVIQCTSSVSRVTVFYANCFLV